MSNSSDSLLGIEPYFVAGSGVDSVPKEAEFDDVAEAVRACVSGVAGGLLTSLGPSMSVASSATSGTEVKAVVKVERTIVSGATEIGDMDPGEMILPEREEAGVVGAVDCCERGGMEIGSLDAGLSSELGPTTTSRTQSS